MAKGRRTQSSSWATTSATFEAPTPCPGSSAAPLRKQRLRLRPGIRARAAGIRAHGPFRASRHAEPPPEQADEQEPDEHRDQEVERLQHLPDLDPVLAEDD